MLTLKHAYSRPIYLNTYKRGYVDQTRNRYTLDREPPLPVYLSLSIPHWQEARK